VPTVVTAVSQTLTLIKLGVIRRNGVIRQQAIVTIKQPGFITFIHHRRA
jgi:hypothetical protein